MAVEPTYRDARGRGRLAPAPEPQSEAAPLAPERRGFLALLLSRFFFFQIRIVEAVVVCSLVALLSGGVAYTLVHRQIALAEVPVPNISGYRIEQAVEILHRQGVELGLQGMDLALKIDRLEQSRRVEKGEIISQFPRPGVLVKAGSLVRVRLSVGSTPQACVDVKGKNHLQAGILLREADLVEGHKSFIANPTVARDLVLAQTPEAGVSIEPGAQVHLLVSLGPESALILMPALKGATATEAEQTLSAIGLRLADIRQEATTATLSGRILRHEPPAGSAVAPGASVTIIVANGAEEL